jgi:hypothetical protein
MSNQASPTQDEIIQRVKKVKARHETQLMKKANVVGVGIGFKQRRGKPTDEIALVVNVIRKLPLSQLAPEDAIPNEIEGVPVDVHETGEIRAF